MYKIIHHVRLPFFHPLLAFLYFPYISLAFTFKSLVYLFIYLFIFPVIPILCPDFISFFLFLSGYFFLSFPFLSIIFLAPFTPSLSLLFPAFLFVSYAPKHMRRGVVKPSLS
jgi:hypothetical protein